MSKRSEKAIELLEDNAIMIDSLLTKDESKYFKNNSFVSYLIKAVKAYGIKTDESTERNI